MRYRFYTCDVFTDVRFGGNPLAVLPKATGLTDHQMQQLAREFNYSESAFVFPAIDGNTRKVRIFTATNEVPFAGHPNIGTAFVLATIGELGDIDDSAEIIFEEKAGLVPITIRKKANDSLWCELKAPEPLSLGATLPIALVASVISLHPDEIVTTTHVPQVASVGLPFVMLELRDRKALEKARINVSRLHEIEALGIVPYLHLYVQSNDEYDIRARMFAPADNVAEDPATGSANCALTAMLTHYDSAETATFAWHIAQGVEINRPSVLDARTEKVNGDVTGVWIAGNCVMVSEGFIELD